MNEIQTVKIQGQGYLLNGTISVPKADGNREYELIKQWLAEGNTPEPEFTEEELLARKEEATRNHFISLYTNTLNTKLKELDYDSLATVKLWEGDVTYGAEASAILTWYKAIIVYTYQLETSVKNGGAIPTDEEYIAGLPAYGV